MYVSIICPVSRLGCDDLIIANLNNCLMPDLEYEIVLFIDNRFFDAFALERKLDSARQFFNIRNLTILKSNKPPASPYNQKERRNRISAAHNLIKQNLGSSDFVFGFEDDTEIPAHALAKLIYDFKELDNPGFIEGVQVGRWGKKYIGAWRHPEPEIYESLKVGEGLQPIDAGGFYCFLTPTSLYKAHEFKWAEPLGPDVQYSYSLTELGYQNYIDWDILTTHKTHQGDLIVKNDVKSLKIMYDGKVRYEYK